VRCYGWSRTEVRVRRWFRLSPRASWPRMRQRKSRPTRGPSS